MGIFPIDQLFGKWAAFDFYPVLSGHEFLWWQVEYLAGFVAENRLCTKIGATLTRADRKGRGFDVVWLGLRGDT
jgi:hypothetical protein